MIYAMVKVEVGDVIYEYPLAELKMVAADVKTEQAVEDWSYFINA